MCRDGFRAPCEEPGCEASVRCRDLPRLCVDHYPDFSWGDGAELARPAVEYVGKHRKPE